MAQPGVRALSRLGAATLLAGGVLADIIQAPATAAVAAPPACGGLNATIVGTEGTDLIIGTPGDDVIVGFGGHDRIAGFGGNDVICGGEGNDSIAAGDGNDRIFGDAGDDKIDGGAGDDQRILGGSGDNTMAGGPGDDHIQITAESTGSDRILGGAGEDWVITFGNDALGEGDFFAGGEGNDRVNGNVDGALVLGGPDDDLVLILLSGTFYGETGNDVSSRRFGVDAIFYGGEGDDRGGIGEAGIFYGEAGNDDGGSVRGTATFLGGEGNDTASSAREQGLYCGGPGDDRLGTLSNFFSTGQGGTFIGEEGHDEVGLLLPGGTFVQDGVCPVAFVPGAFS